MSTTQFISVRETGQILAISEKKVMDLIEQRELQAYRIADKFLRLKKSDVLKLRNAGVVETEIKPIEFSAGERLADFIYFNDFYIASICGILLLLYIIFFT